MARLLYVFPHPDDESFGPGPAIAQQRRQGHEVYLLTLTRGEATSQRDRLGYSKEQMGQVRYDEMKAVAETLDLSGMTVLDYPDGELDVLDPLGLEGALARHIEDIRPDVLVTYAVHGISGHPDHLVAHGLVKHAFARLRAGGADYLRRLAFFTLPPLPDDRAGQRPEHLNHSALEDIDAVIVPQPEDLERGRASLACYETYQTVIEEHQPLREVEAGVCFELFQEHFDPPLDDLCDRLP